VVIQLINRLQISVSNSKESHTAVKKLGDFMIYTNVNVIDHIF